MNQRLIVRCILVLDMPLDEMHPMDWVLVLLRSTFLNVPHSWVPTGHFGWTLQVGESYNRRVRWIADVDFEQVQ